MITLSISITIKREVNVLEYKVFESMIHPIRMKIVQEILKKQTATTKDISEAITDVPPASLYRHINKLLSDNIIEVVSENKVRGTLEKVFRIKFNPFDEISKTVESQDKEQLLNLFYNFSMNLLSDFQKYVSQENINLLEDGFGFRSYALYLTDEEFKDLIKGIGSAIVKYLNNEPAPERKLRKLSTVITPINE
jgi:DNA-binding transcriptional ArsR family regulator